jgi:hypothetical protein
MPRWALAAGLLGGLIALAGLHLWQGHAYWDYSEGTYILSARLLYQGADLYRHMVGAQPPGVFLAGAGLLRIHDSLEGMRLAIGLVQLGGGLIAARAAWRLSGSAAAAAIAPALVLLTPWAVHEHGALTPELLAGPVLLGGALLVARPRTCVVGGAIAALAIGLKLPLALPVAGIVLCAADRRRAALAALATVAAMALAAEVAYGSALWHDTVVAQFDTGRRTPYQMLQIWGQEGWNLFGLVLPAAALIVLVRGRVRDRALGRAWLGLCAGLVVTALSNYKEGTGLNILVPVEAALVPPALAGAALLSGRATRIAAVACLVAVAVETGSLMISPRTATPFIYPSSQRGSWGRTASADEVDAEVARLRACPPGVATSDAPFYAFLAHRRPPDGQADGFLTLHAKTKLADVARRMAADVPRCP